MGRVDDLVERDDRSQGVGHVGDGDQPGPLGEQADPKVGKYEDLRPLRPLCDSYTVPIGNED